MKKIITFIAIFFTCSFLIAACDSNNNEDESGNNSNRVTNNTNDTNENNRNNNHNEHNNDDNNNENTSENDDDNEYGDHELKEHLSLLDYSDGSDDLELRITDINLGELHVNDDSTMMFQDRDTVPTVGLILEIENKSDDTLVIDTGDIRLAEDDNDPGDEPDPILSDDFNDEIESGGTLTGTLYYFKRKDSEDLTDFIVRSSKIVRDGGDGDTDIHIDISLD